MFKRKISLRRLIITVISAAGIYLFITCLPDPLFVSPVSTVLLDRNGNLLGASIASDGQWRFPENKIANEKFSKSIIAFEDKRFYNHPGIDFLAIGRAIWYNTKAWKVKSGGSTITMQVIRLSRKGRGRTIFEKIIEMFMALRMEIRYSKSEILSMYASYAPFGGNVVGLDAASWRYFGKSQDKLSWAEAASLAVMPNSPSVIRPGKNATRLLKKRNELLDKLSASNIIDRLSNELAKTESIASNPFVLPRLAPHLLTRIIKEQKGDKPAVIKSTLIIDLQRQVSEIIKRHHETLKGNGINNASAIVVDVESGNVLAYVGNIFPEQNIEMNSEVDIITAPRSTGSILKPFLYSAMLSEGEILPGTLIPDIPTQIAGYSPQNFNKTFDGAVPAQRALERSLNIPAVRMLKTYGTGKFNLLLKKQGMTTLSKSPDYYGLSIILGGSEGSLWDIAGMYASMCRTLNNFGTNSGRYDPDDIHPLKCVKGEFVKKKSINQMNAAGNLSASSIWCALNAMEEVNRPDIENNWREFSSSQRIAWKTGTSFGFRDGWAVGCTKKYVVAVWTGNADGEGRPGLIGVATAAPIMFNIFNLLKATSWFEQPFDDMEKIAVCKLSGHRATEICEETDSIWVPRAGLRTSPCPYHQIIHLDRWGKFRVSSDCESPSQMLHRSWFVLPPAQEWFYKSGNHQYKVLPPYRQGCKPDNNSPVMEFIYPKKSTQIYIPIELDGTTGKAIFEVVHRNPKSIIYWHLDDDYLGYTKQFHQMALSPAPGKHVITLIDENGERMEKGFEVIK